MDKDSKVASVSLKTLLKTGAIVLAVLFLTLTTFVYSLPQNTLSMRIRHVLPYPAILINGTDPIFFDDVDNDLASIRRFYESQSDDLSKAGLRTDFSTPEGKKRLMIREKELLNKMVEDKAILELAHERNIDITPEAVREAVKKKMNEISSQEGDVSSQLERLYGWTLDDFEQKIVQPEMYKEELSKVYADNTDVSSRAKQRMQDAQNELKQRTSFEDVARKYSEGVTAQDGGELGWIPASALTPEINQVIQKQKVGKVTDVIESPLGFHIVMVEERKQEQNQDMFRLKQIFTRKITFSDWLTSQMKQMNIVVLFRGYKWEKETSRIDFKQPDMKSFEEEALQKSQGDASLIF